MAKGILRDNVSSFQSLSGYRGSGKTTELFRPGKLLADEGCQVIYANAGSHLSNAAPVDTGNFLLVLAGAFNDALVESWWNRKLTQIFANGSGGLICQALGVNVLRGVHDDEHGAAAALAVVIIFGRHFGIRWDGDLEGLEAGGPGDGMVDMGIIQISNFKEEGGLERNRDLEIAITPAKHRKW